MHAPHMVSSSLNDECYLPSSNISNKAGKQASSIPISSSTQTLAPILIKEMSLIWNEVMPSSICCKKHGDGDDDGYDYAPAACVEGDGDDDDGYDYAPATCVEGDGGDDDGDYDYAAAASMEDDGCGSYDYAPLHAPHLVSSSLNDECHLPSSNISNKAGKQASSIPISNSTRALAPLPIKEMSLIWDVVMPSSICCKKHGDGDDDGDDGYDYAPVARVEGDGDDGDYDYAPAASMEGDGGGGYDYASVA